MKGSWVKLRPSNLLFDVWAVGFPAIKKHKNALFYVIFEDNSLNDSIQIDINSVLP